MKMAARPRPGICAIVTATIALSCAAALADDTKPPAVNAPLPGVDPARTEPDYRQPAPAPNDPATHEPGPRDGFVRMGDWDVKVSGSVSYEMGFGTGSGRR